MSFNISVVTHPTADISKPSLIIEDRSSGNRTIIGNVPAGLQRKCNEMGLKTSRLTNIFLSGILNWESLAGLPGLILTVSDQGAKSLGLYHSGNKVLQYIISSWRYFIFRFGIDLKAEDIDDSIEAGSITYTPINIKSTIPTENNDGKEEDHLKLRNFMSGIFPLQVNSSKPLYNSKKLANLTLPESIVNPKVSTNWIVVPKPIRGKFLVNVAKQLGCQIPHFKPLCNFQSVTLDDGTIITPEQVLEPTRYFNPILVLDIPSKEYLDNTLSYDFIKDAPDGLSYSVVFHFIDDSIEEPLTDQYIEFINKFGPSTMHFIGHKSYCPNTLNFQKTLRVSMKWKSILPSFYPLPKWNVNAQNKLTDALPNVLPMISGQNIEMKSTTGTQLDDTTKLGLGASIFSDADAKKLYNVEIISVGLPDSLENAQFEQVVDEIPNTRSLKTSVDPTKDLKEQAETLILGTGSAIPSSLRNVLCNIVRVPYITESGTSGFRTVVLDAGEGSFGTLKRTYCPEEVEMLLDELDMVYLSHLHADHHLGIIDFIREWNKREEFKHGVNRTKSLYIITPWQYDNFMRELNKIDHFVDMKYVKYISCDEFMIGFISPSFEQQKIENLKLEDLGSVKQIELEYKKDNLVSGDLYRNLGMAGMKTCSAFHCEYSYSCSMSFKLNLDGDNSQENIFKFAYSGDTRPKAAFSFIGRNSDLLIHESTLDDDKYADAVGKRHSTTSEAVQVGILMKAKKIILTHFSQRYKSFTCSSEVYDRLKNPKSRADFVGEEFPDKIELKRTKSSDTLSNIDETLPLELQSNIFNESIDQETRDNAANIEILFAFDNMIVEYKNFGLQRQAFEKYGSELEKLFSNDWDDVDEVEDDVVAENTVSETNANKKKTKKQNKENSTKKRKITPPSNV